jgi:serine/threonine protein phosphatase PrpC
MFDYRVFTLAKDARREEENQDASAVDAVKGRAAVADGVASSIFSRRWAQIVTQSAIQSIDSPDSGKDLTRWLRSQRRAWESEVDEGNLAWHQKPKLKDGAYATIVSFWLEIAEESNPLGDYRMHAWAIGDSCLLHIQDNQLLRAFPLESPVDFDAHPQAIGSADKGKDDLINVQILSDYCDAGDQIVLCTDCLASFALEQDAAGKPQPWNEFMALDDDDWKLRVEAMRAEHLLKYDDTTAIVITPHGVGPRG